MQKNEHQNDNKHDFNDLDSQFEDVITWLQTSQVNGRSAPVDFKTSLRTQLYDRAIARQKNTPPRSRLIPLTIGVMALLIVFGLALWFIDQRPVSAAEIVDRATIAATNTAAFGLKSYSGVRLNWVRNTYCTTCSSQKDNPLELLWQDRNWFQAPNLSRREMYSYLEQFHNPALAITRPVFKDVYGDMIASATIINDGSIVWWYDIMNHAVRQYTPSTKHVDSEPTKLSELIKKLGNDGNVVTLLGTQTIAGRTAYILSFTPKPDLTVWPYTAQIKSWIDKETYFQLGQEFLDKYGETLSKWLYIKFEPNIELSPDLFVYRQPEGVEGVTDLRTPRDEADLAQAWRTAALIAPYKVFRPINVPEKFIMDRPTYGYGGGNSSIGVMPTQQSFYLEGEELPVLVIVEQPASLGYDGERIKLGDYEGRYLEESGRRFIFLERDSTFIFLQANQRALTKDELIQIAATLELVPKE